jgi:hypothetical protein
MGQSGPDLCESGVFANFLFSFTHVLVYFEEQIRGIWQIFVYERGRQHGPSR